MQQNVTEAITLEAAADLSAKQYHLLRLSTDWTCNQASTSITPIVGVLQNIPQSGEAATVGIMGISRVVVGSTVAAGDFLTTSASGRAVKCAPASGGASAYAIGMALEAGTTDGDIISAYIRPCFRYVGV